MVWATNNVSQAEAGQIQELFNKHFDALQSVIGHRPDMLLVEGEPSLDPLAVTLVLGLPSKDLLTLYPGFTEIGERELPKKASHSAGRQDIFDATFKTPH